MQTAQLRTLFAQRDWQSLTASLDRLTNAEFRQAERLVRDELMPTLPNDDFWTAYVYLIIYRRQAFLSCIRAVHTLATARSLSFETEAARQVARELDEVNALKVIDMALPLLQTEEQISGIFRLFNIDDEQKKVSLLIRIDTPLAYYMLFRTLCHLPDNHALALRCYRFILRRQNDSAFNMCSILRSYFGLTEAQEQLSLRIEPYELSYLDRSYDRFVHVLNGKRPRL